MSWIAGHTRAICNECGQSVVGESHIETGVDSWWQALPHDGPCGLPCAGGAGMRWSSESKHTKDCKECSRGLLARAVAQARKTTMRMSRREFVENLLNIREELKHLYTRVEGMQSLSATADNMEDAEYHMRKAIEAISCEIGD